MAYRVYDPTRHTLAHTSTRLLVHPCTRPPCLAARVNRSHYVAEARLDVLGTVMDTEALPLLLPCDVDSAMFKQARVGGSMCGAEPEDLART